MTPRLAFTNSLDCAFTYKVSTRKYPVGLPTGKTLAYLPHLAFSKTMFGVINTALSQGWIEARRGLITFSRTLFGNHVCGVRGVVAQEKVSRVDTPRRVAPMQNKHSLRDAIRPMFKLVGKSVSESEATKIAYLPVTRGINASEPKPAAIGFLNLAPKTLRPGASRSNHFVASFSPFLDYCTTN